MDQLANLELVTESDVEQKLLHPLLTLPAPAGLGFTASSVRTKTSLNTPSAAGVSK